MFKLIYIRESIWKCIKYWIVYWIGYSHLSRSNIKKNKIVQAIRQCRGLLKTYTKILRCVTTFLDGGFWRYSSKSHFFLTFWGPKTYFWGLKVYMASDMLILGVVYFIQFLIWSKYPSNLYPKSANFWNF